MNRRELDHLNGAILAFLVGLMAFQAFLFPMIFQEQASRYVWLLIPAFLINNTTWAMIHEAIHGGLHSDRITNELLGRMICIAYGCPLTAARIPHLVHHKLNRTSHDTAEIFHPETKSRLAAAWSFFSIILGGLYLRELFFPILSLLPADTIRAALKRYPKGSTAWESGREILDRPGALVTLRLDAVLSWGWIALSMAFYWRFGVSLWIPVAFYTWRALNISFTDYVYHYGTPKGNVAYARNLELPSWASRFILHFNYHGVHHRFPRVPWIQLPAAFQKLGRKHEMPFFKSAFRQFHGPMTPEEHLRWSKAESM